MHEYLLKILAINSSKPYNISMRTSSPDKLYSKMKEGRVYRREELDEYSSAVDRDLNTLIKKALIKKLASGLYLRPKKSKWGEVPADAEELVRAFLKTDDFLLTSLNVFNKLPLGLTQLSNVPVVYNRKRLGRFKLGNQIFYFKRPVNFPNELSQEFLYVDLLNNLESLPEKSDELELKLRIQLKELPSKKLLECAERFGKRSTQVKLKELLEDAA